MKKYIPLIIFWILKMIDFTQYFLYPQYEQNPLYFILGFERFFIMWFITLIFASIIFFKYIEKKLTIYALWIVNTIYSLIVSMNFFIISFSWG